MNSIIFGTTNPAKIIHVQAALEPLGIKVGGIGSFDNLPKIKEDGKTPWENARKKAVTYCQAINQPVLSMDNALYIDGLTGDEQPGLHARRIPGGNDNPSDDELTDYYSSLFEKHGGNMTGHWEFAMYLAFPDGRIKGVTGISDTRNFSSKVCPKRMAGYPLYSMQIDSKTGKYVVEMTKEERDKFWQDSVGKELRELFNRV